MKITSKSESEKLTAREKIINTALILFNENGVHATGIDRIILESKVAKMTFYKHFPSKDTLVEVYYEESDKIRFRKLNAYTIDKYEDPKKQILGIFDYLKNWFEQPDFKGCPFVRGLSDFAIKKHTVNYNYIQFHFVKWNDFVRERLLRMMKAGKAEVILTQILSLIMGSVTLALAGADKEITQVNKKLVELILEKY